ncbi:MAG: C39 family peptidase [Planctomycetes bacterium]|nr:C39 family peptidase [Planctomycetota bacterium]
MPTLPALLSVLITAFAASQKPGLDPASAAREDVLSAGFFTWTVRTELGTERGSLGKAQLEALPSARVEPGRDGLHFASVGTSEGELAWVELAPLDAPPFRDVVCSWNARVPSGAGVSFELRVAGEAGAWSPWLHVGDWGEPVPGERVLSFDGGKVDVDAFTGARLFGRVQLRVRAARAAGAKLDAGPATVESVVLERVSVCVSDRESDAEAVFAAWNAKHPGVGCVPTGGTGSPHPGRGVALDVPFRSQKSEDPAIASRICSPTSLAMVLAYRGVDVPTAEVARVCYDAEHALYGNWTRAIQGAFTLGVPGYLTRFGGWRDVERTLARGEPLVISIGVKKGQLTGAPYESTSGHLLVLRGFDKNGDGLVNDPAAVDAKRGRCTYKRSELETCWLARGGTAYVLLPRPEAQPK